MTVYLIPVGHRRFDLYSEAEEEPPPAAEQGIGRGGRWVRGARLRWHRAVEEASRGDAGGLLRRWRAALVRHVAETIAEQQTLWSLRRRGSATLRFQSTLDRAEALSILLDILARARRHHGRWLIADLTFVVLSGLLALVPGPNLVAYYFVFRLAAHLQSWRSAAHAAARVSWTFEPDAELAELDRLVGQPRSERGPLVDAVAAKMNLPHLSTFFERAAEGPA